MPRKLTDDVSADDELTDEEIEDVSGGGLFGNKRAARTGRNPQTGAEIKIAARKVVKFKPGKDFAEKVK